MSKDTVVIGLDVGTGGARALAVTPTGKVVAEGSAPILAPHDGGVPGGSQQHPQDWWQATQEALRQITARLQGHHIAGICADSTSGTIVPVDTQLQPLRPALLHNDSRATDQANQLNAIAHSQLERLGYRFNASFALSKVLWILQHEPQLYERTRWFLHATDYLVACLSGGRVVSDPSNCMKLGYDLIDLCWPAYPAEVGLDTARFPEVCPSGTVVAAVSTAAGSATGLPPDTPIIAGVTDSTAGFLASGAAQPGQYCTTLGTTLAIKGVSSELVRDPLGRCYCHRHPGGGWLPLWASNAGGGVPKAWFAGADWSRLDRECADLPPAQAVCYPLVEKGERLPFVCADAEGFCQPHPQQQAEYYAAVLDGVAVVERWCYELLGQLGGAATGPIRATGRASSSLVWLQRRADALGLPMAQVAVTESALGAAVLAATAVCYDGCLADATRHMTRLATILDPRPDRFSGYTRLYQQLQTACAERGWTTG